MFSFVIYCTSRPIPASAPPAKIKYVYQKLFIVDSRRVLVGTPGTKGAGSKTHLKSRFCAISKKGEQCYDVCLTVPAGPSVS